MTLYNKLAGVYPSCHFSLCSTQTRIEEDEPEAVTKEVIVEHTGIEVLKINKSLLVAIRDVENSEHVDVCDGILATEQPSGFIGYFELKSACTKGNVLKARKQILDSQHHLNTAFIRCAIDKANLWRKASSSPSL